MAQIKDLKRMCVAHTDCLKCGLYVNDRCRIYYLPDNADEIVDEWVKGHPVKTYAMDFFEKFPNAPKEDDGTPIPCVEDIYGVGKQLKECPNGDIGCLKCWNQEMQNG